MCSGGGSCRCCFSRARLPLPLERRANALDTTRDAHLGEGILLRLSISVIRCTGDSVNPNLR
jgi:hypothetical protein